MSEIVMERAAVGQLAGWSWRDLYTLCKPRVVAVMLVCTLVGMLLAAPMPGAETVLFGLAGIGLAAGGAAAYNHVVDRRLDAMMLRTAGGPWRLSACPRRWRLAGRRCSRSAASGCWPGRSTR